MRAVEEHGKTGRGRLTSAAIALVAAVFAVGWAARAGDDATRYAATTPAALSATAVPSAGPSLAAIAGVGAAAATVAAPAVSAEVTDLAQDLAGMIRVQGWSNDAWGVLVVSLDHGDTLFAHRADQPLTPASNLKLYTSAGALYYLGPQYRYGTYLATSGSISDGVLEGDLHVYGTGDPSLSDRIGTGGLAVWQAFADTLAALGVREVRGDVIGDGSYFEGPATGAGWQTSYINAWYAAPAGALSFNENIVTLRIHPGEEVGWRPRVQTVPGAAGVAIVNLATTVDGAGGRIQVTRAAYDGPIVVRGEIGRGAGNVWHAVPVPDPARFAAAAFREVLIEKGIAVTGGAGAIHDPAQSLFSGRKIFAPGFDQGPSPRVIAVHRSPPLLEILKIVNKRSHNLYAEQVLRTIGRVAAGSGSVAGGGRAIQVMIERESDAPPAPLSMHDGSGLSILDRATPEGMVQVLSVMSRSPMFQSYLATLPEAGERGLRRMGSTAAQGNLRAKTGTINNVSALSGYVTAANGERLAFSILSNEVPSTWRAKRVEDQIGARLASFTRPPPAGRTAAAARDTARRIDGAGQTPPAARPVAPAAPPPADTPPEAEPAAPSTHVIRSGDTLDGIARTYGTTVEALRQANPGVNPRRLIPGREVKLP